MVADMNILYKRTFFCCFIFFFLFSFASAQDKLGRIGFAKEDIISKMSAHLQGTTGKAEIEQYRISKEFIVAEAKSKLKKQQLQEVLDFLDSPKWETGLQQTPLLYGILTSIIHVEQTENDFATNGAVKGFRVSVIGKYHSGEDALIMYNLYPDNKSGYYLHSSYKVK